MYGISTEELIKTDKNAFLKYYQDSDSEHEDEMIDPMHDKPVRIEKKVLKRVIQHILP